MDRSRILCVISLALVAVTVVSVLNWMTLPTWWPYVSMACALASLVTAIWAAVIEINREPSRLLLPIISLMASVVLVGGYLALLAQLYGLARMH